MFLHPPSFSHCALGLIRTLWYLSIPACASAMAPYTRIEEGEESAGVVTPVAPRRSGKWVAVAAAAVGAATIGYVAMDSAKGVDEVVSKSFAVADADESMTLTVTNEDYSTPPSSLNSGLYSWSYNMEPERVNYLSVSLADSR